MATKKILMVLKELPSVAKGHEKYKQNLLYELEIVYKKLNYRGYLNCSSNGRYI